MIKSKSLSSKINFLIILLLISFKAVFSQSKIIKLDEFIDASCKNDPAFQYILADKLFFEYQKTLSVPVKEILFDATGSYGINFEADHFPLLRASLKNLFPDNGSKLELFLESSYSGGIRRNSLGLTYNIEFIKNAFGRTHGVYHKKAKLNESIALYQILQTYEAYLSSLIFDYFDWLKAYNNMLSANISYNEGLKLLENVEKKKSYYIAYQIDVDKAKLQVADKREKLRAAQESFANFSIGIAYSLGDSLNSDVVPDTMNSDNGFNRIAENIIDSIPFDSTRSGKIFSDMMILDSMDMLLAMEELLPSFTGFGSFVVGERDGDMLSNTIVSTGVTLSFPFKKTHKKAEIEMVKLDKKKISINAGNVKSTLLMNLAKLKSDIKFEKESIEMSEERLKLSEKVFEAEQKDYQSGRSSLNDLIQALNTIESYRLFMSNAKIELAKKRLMILDALDLLVTEIEE